ncbi:VENN motif pre-toxin domain-containing protein [Enterobacter roggenkampii]|nr:VENN motif pre-toxin domain-containing protein [Enterobacter roggenkampii]CAE6275835.1 16S rRNA endonuclease CdiA [Enterobacter cloacae]MCD5288897.1 VENN motif pre-toxin domain-containing protein [Enterobacter roggenkampii]MCU3050412.1 VENN motif pre-toxin domain-containing protein [Enterobacter roggenkampii]MCU3820043.1 VENN motif pre-toxin domain-containing protein [Enterobacter roggenkampii]MEA8897584.1 VENN motif pre-toxin domain-containing protein [Enterobacter roggenkampii]
MYQTFYNEAFNQSGMGTGQSTQRAITAATAAIQALAGGDIKAAIAGGAAPYIANAIANAIPEKDLKGRVLAHAVVNAALAAASGRDAASAAAGAAVGELAGKIAVDGFGKQVSELSEEEKQTVSALATLASGLAGGLVGDRSANAVAAAQAGKTTVENNSLSEHSPFEHEEEEHEKELGNGHIKIIPMNPGLEPERDEAGNPITYAPGFGVPIGSAVRLPSGYTPTGRGDVVGPKGGMYTNTGKTDSSGNAIYSNNGSYYTFDSTSKNGTLSPNPANQIRQNYDQGKAFEDSIYQKYSQGMTDSAREVTIKTGSGVNVRVDIMTKDSSGNIFCVECKSSETAPLTPNQKIGYPEIENSGGVIMGVGKPGFDGGTVIPPTKIDVIRPGKDKG